MSPTSSSSSSGDDDIRYTTSGGLDIAYKVVGSGPLDIVAIPGLIDTLEGLAGYLPSRQFADGVARFGRVIRFDKRGTGLSDRLPPGTSPTIEERVDDAIAVMDAANCPRAAVMGTADGAPVAMMLAASHPERVSALVLSAASGRAAWSEATPWGVAQEEFDARLEFVRQNWGSGLLGPVFGATDERSRREFARLERLASTPSAAVQQALIMWETDVRSVLPTIAVPTLVIHNVEHTLWPIEGARDVARLIPGARLVELPGQPGSLAPWGNRDDIIDVIEEFVTGRQPERVFDRVLKTVMFTDIVDSTATAARVGDRQWRGLLDEHEATARRVIEEFQGHLVNTTGDGVFATFDGPARAIACARELSITAEQNGLPVRIGIHTGECEVRGDDYAGIAVHIGARVGAIAGTGEILVTSTVRDLVAGSGIEFTDRGSHTLKGVPGSWHVLGVS